jgi:hypothetical protein
MKVRRIIDSLVFAVMRSRAVRRVFGYLAYHAKRAERRDLEARLRAQGVYPTAVERGPFQGLQLPPPATYISCRFEKAIGTYEHEIHPLLERLRQTQDFRVVINIGAADGFYSVGLARLFPAAQVISYETAPHRRAVLQQVAELNHVADRMDVRAACSPAALRELGPTLTGPPLVFCDVDTYETVLLDLDQVPWLRTAFILVELHDCMEPGITATLRQRFAPTHQITQVTNRGVAYGEYPLLRPMSFPQIYAMVAEDRKGLQDWFLLEPKAVN